MYISTTIEMVVHFNVFRPSLRVPSLPGARRAWALTCDLWVTGFISSLSPGLYLCPSSTTRHCDDIFHGRFTKGWHHRDWQHVLWLPTQPRTFLDRTLGWDSSVSAPNSKTRLGARTARAAAAAVTVTARVSYSS